MSRGFEGLVENFDGLELIGWISFDETFVPELYVEVDGFGRRQILDIKQRPDLNRRQRRTFRRVSCLSRSFVSGSPEVGKCNWS